MSTFSKFRETMKRNFSLAISRLMYLEGSLMCSSMQVTDRVEATIPRQNKASHLPLNFFNFFFYFVFFGKGFIRIKHIPESGV